VEEKFTYFGLGPDENYPDRQGTARIGKWELPLEKAYTPYIFPSENGLRQKVSNLKYGDLSVSAANAEFSFNLSRFSQKQLQEKDHRNLLVPEQGSWLNLDGFHMGVGGDDSWSPSVSPEFLLSDSHYHYELTLQMN
jgi:beta-galactosidase